MIDHEASIAVALFVERGGAGLSLSGGLGVVVEDDAVGEVQVDQVWLLVAGDFAREEGIVVSAGIVLHLAIAVVVVDIAFVDTLSTDVHGDIGTALERGKRVLCEEFRIDNE